MPPRLYPALACLSACLFMCPAFVMAQIDQAPTISPIGDMTIDENPSLAQLVTIPFTVDDPDDSPSGWIVFSTFTGSGGFVGSMSISGTGSSRQLLVAVAPERFGVADITITFQSKPNSVALRTFRLTVRQVKRPPVFLLEPQDQGTVLGRGVQYRINVGGEPTPSVAWQVSVDGGTTWTGLSALFRESLVFGPVASDNGKQFRVIATNSEGTVISRAATLTIRRTQPDDKDGDGLSDLIVWRGPTGSWQWLNSSARVSTEHPPSQSQQFGSDGQGDIPLTGDTDGNGTADIVVWRPSTGTWYLANSVSTVWGAAGDVPFLGNMDGDRVADTIVWRPSTGTWFWQTRAAKQIAGSVQWGNASLGDRPLVGDFDGDRLTDFGVWRASAGTFYWLTSSTGYTYVTARAVQWGSEAHGDVPLIGDFDGDGKSDVAVWRASTGTWFWLQSSKGYAYAGQQQVQWGNASLGDIPVVKEIDGDGTDDIVVWRASTGVWYWLTSSTAYRHVNAGAQAWGDASLGDRIPRR